MSDPSVDDAALQGFVGRTLQDRYRIDALLGSGGMGAVFRAHHFGLDQDVALKVLLPHTHGGTIATARFRREARSASRLDHPSCVRVLDFGELEDGTKFLVMQLVSGEELSRRLGSPWPALLAVDLALQILGGLTHAHGRGVVHRDLKPENVLLTTDDDGRLSVKLVDFGIAKLLEEGDGEAKLTRTGMRFGTPRYMSPEQAGGGKVDERTDLYAVGLLLYEMLAGHPPFLADDVAAMMRMQVLSPPPPLPDGVPPSLAAVVMRLLAKSRKERFPTAKDTMSALFMVRAELAAQTVPDAGVPAGTPPTAPTIGVTTAVEGTWSANPIRPSRTKLPLLIGVGVLLVLWVAAAIVAIFVPNIGTDEPSAVVVPPPSAAATPPLPPGSERQCKGSSDCALTCGEDCEVKCSGSGDCVVDVGEKSRVKCTGSGDCDVTCRGECAVKCRGRGDCELHCVDERASGPRECRKGTRACGPCP